MTTIAPMMAAPAAAPTTPDAPARDDGFGAEYEQVAARVDRARGARTGASGRDHRADEASNEDAAVEESEQSEHVGESTTEVPSTEAEAAAGEPTVDDAATETDAAAATLAVAASAPAADVPADDEANAATTSVDATTSGIDPSTSAVAAPDADAEPADGSTPVAEPAVDAELADGADVVSEDAPVSSDRSAPAQGVDEDPTSAPVASETDAATGSAETVAPDASVEADATTPTGPRSVEAPARADAAANSADVSAARRADGVASTAASARADAAPTAQTTRTEAWEQVATVVRPLRLTADGSHRVALQLTPDELGTVHLEVALRDGRLSIHAVAETAAARDALAGSLPQLRATLTSSGIDLGTLDVSDGSSGSDPDGRSGTERGKGSATPARPDVLLRPGPAGPPTLVHTTHRHGGTAGPGAVDLAL